MELFEQIIYELMEAEELEMAKLALRDLFPNN